MKFNMGERSTKKKASWPARGSRSTHAFHPFISSQSWCPKIPISCLFGALKVESDEGSHGRTRKAS